MPTRDSSTANAVLTLFASALRRVIGPVGSPGALCGAHVWCTGSPQVPGPLKAIGVPGSGASMTESGP